jgi:hypothetical protein
LSSNATVPVFNQVNKKYAFQYGYQPKNLQQQKHIHYNPVRAGLCEMPEDYHYSSAGFYYDGSNNFGMLTHFTGN